jgi:hypothetical protein
MSFRLILIPIISILSGHILFCQQDSTAPLKHPVIISKLTRQVNFDGNPDEEAWNSVTPLRMTMHSPVFGREPTEESDIRIGFDDKNLYVGARLFYHDAGMIRSASFKRDFMGSGSDWFGIILDTYNDKENGLLFFTTPDGLRIDANVQRDAVVTQSNKIPYNISWNAFWDVRTKRDQKGWSAEIRIPLSSLRFQVINDEVLMGIIVQRWIPAKNEMIVFPAIPPNWGPNSPLKPSQAQEVIFPGVKSDKPLYIAPYMLTGYDSRNNLNQVETDYLRSDKPALEAGLDVKYGISSNMVMDLTVNTDFAQVEADDQQINLSRFSLYFPEKRTFFLERASTFDFSLGGNNNLFYSRRIGLSNSGDPVRIYGGARVTGRLGKWDLGFLDMQTAALWKNNYEGIREEIQPSENFGVLRFRRQIINDNSYIGTMLTSRLGVDGSYNLAYGIDGTVRLFGDDYLDIKASQSLDNDLESNSFAEPSRLVTNWQRRSEKGLGYTLGYSYAGTDYKPGIGFERLIGYSYWRGDLKYGWLPDENSILYRHSPEVKIKYWTYADDGSLMTYENEFGWSFETKNKWEGEVALVYSIENLKDTLEIQDNIVYTPPGKYEFVYLKGTLSTSVSKPLYTLFAFETGEFYDGSRFSFSMLPTWNISKHFELGGTYNFDHVKFKNRNQEMSNHILGIKALYMLDIHFSVNVYLQYNTSSEKIISNFRLRYNPKEGNDFYLVFNEGRNTNMTDYNPHLPVYNVRNVILKYTYTFNL